MQTYYKTTNCAYWEEFSAYVINNLNQAIQIVANDYKDFYQYELRGESLGYGTTEIYVNTSSPIIKEDIAFFEDEEYYEIVKLSNKEVSELRHTPPLEFIDNLEYSFEELCESLNVPYDFKAITKQFLALL